MRAQPSCTSVLCLALAMVGACAQGSGDPPPGGRDAGAMDAGAFDAGDGPPCTPACAPSQVCQLGRCLQRCSVDGSCVDGLSCCDGACINLANDQFHCGACGNLCAPGGTVCFASECRCGPGPSCAAPQNCCGNMCVDLSTTITDCGACGVACADGQACVGGVCEDAPCEPPCGDGETCGADGTCSCGTGPACPALQSCCGSACLDVSADSSNCGRCGVMCDAVTETCMGGTCTTDVECMPACATGESCAMGSCMCGSNPSCTGGTACCGDSCRDVTRDVLHCGACGRTCPGGFACCNSRCVDVMTDRNNCGSCGNDCGDTGDNCSSGRCMCGSNPECLIPPCLAGMCIFV